MCGYFCIFGPESNDTDRLEIKNLNKILNHRGPDDFRSLKGKILIHIFGGYPL